MEPLISHIREVNLTQNYSYLSIYSYLLAYSRSSDEKAVFSHQFHRKHLTEHMNSCSFTPILDKAIFFPQDELCLATSQT